MPAKALFASRMESSQPADVHLTPSQALGVLPQVDYMERTGNKVVLQLAESAAMKHVEPRDFISHLRSFQGGLEYSSYRGKVSSAYSVFRPRADVDDHYYAYVFKSRRYVQALQSTTGQLRDGQSIRFGQFASIPLPLPPLEEQQQIAAYLDRETGQIDELIAKQEQLLTTLAERRQAVVEWATSADGTGANEVPLRRLVKKVDQGVSPDAEAALAVGDTWGVVKSGCVNGGVFNDEQHKRLDGDFVVDEAMQIRRGDFVVSRASGSVKLVGSAAIVRDIRYRLILSDKTYRFTFVAGTDPEFIEWSFQSTRYRQQVIAALTGAGGLANNISLAALRAIRLAVPAVERQREIAADLASKVAAIDTLSNKATQMIALLRERRQALISAAVTGKIDVRSA